ncbi:MAG: HEAT repeat domain-containing protein [Candidatus Thorarchaeota archaeon]
MSKDLKDLIDSIEIKEAEKSDYEQTIDDLREKINKLNFTIDEQKLLIQEQEKKLAESEELEVPGELQILKDMIITQRQDIKKKDKDIEILEEKIDELLVQLDKSKKKGNEIINNEELIEAKKLIVQLTKENEIFKQNKNNAKDLIKNLKEKKEDYRIKNRTLKAQLCDLESKTFEKKISEISSEEVERATTSAENLKTEVINLKNEIIHLKQNLETLESPSEEQLEEINQLNGIIEKFLIIEKQNNKLKKDLDTANITINNLVEEVNSKTKEISNQENEIRKKNVKISALTEKFESSKRRNIELQEEFDNFSKDSALFKEKMEYYERELQASEKTIKKLKDQNTPLNDLVSELNNGKLSTSNNLNIEIHHERDVEELIEYLKRENQQLKKSIIELRSSESNSSVKSEVNDSSYEDLLEINRHLKADNKQLNSLISELKKIKTISSDDMIYNITVNHCTPKYYQNLLFIRLFNNLDTYKRELLIDSLIQDLVNSKNLDIKRYIIDILSEIKDERRILDTFVNMIKNEEWIIRLYLVKALSKFDLEDIKEPLEELLNDADLDVREAAKDTLKKVL